MHKFEHTVVSDTGLRYTSKDGGSPFQGMGGTGETLSCIKCGLHRPRRSGVFKRYLTALMFFCLDCKPVKTQHHSTGLSRLDRRSACLIVAGAKFRALSLIDHAVLSVPA